MHFIWFGTVISIMHQNKVVLVFIFIGIIIDISLMNSNSEFGIIWNMLNLVKQISTCDNG